MAKLNIVYYKNDNIQLIDQSWSIEKIASEVVPKGWESLFEHAIPELKDISDILAKDEMKYGQFFPLKRDIFAAFHNTPLNNVNVVIIGQDPYHQRLADGNPRAVGLSFSVRQNDVIPSSLKNIYKELDETVRGFKKPDHGDLTEWTRQGVLLLNSCLTVRQGKPGSHSELWLGFINKVFKAISNVNPYCIYLLWGKEAQKLKPMLGEKSIIFEANHPSGYSAHRGFFGCNHFNLVNDTLIKHGKNAIKWSITPRINSTNPTMGSCQIGDDTPNSSTQKRNLIEIDITSLPTMIKSDSRESDSTTHITNCRSLPIIPGIKDTPVQATTFTQHTQVSGSVPSTKSTIRPINSIVS